MNTIDKLMLYPQIPTIIEKLSKQMINSIAEKYNTCVTAQLTGLPGKKQPGDPTYRAVERIMMKHDKNIEEISKQIGEYMDIHANVSMALLELTPEEKKIIELRCFSRRHWDEVSRSARYSLRQCRRLYDSGIIKISTK